MDLNNLKLILSNNIYEYFGIDIPENEIDAYEANNTISFKVHNSDFASYNLESETFDEDDFIFELFEGNKKLKDKLIKIKNSQLNEILENKKEQILQILSKYLDSETIDNLDIDIKDVGYNSKHWMTEEAEQGYPIFVISITDFEDFDFSYEIQNDFGKELFDKEQFENSLKAYIEENT